MSRLTRLSPEGFHFQLFTFSFFEFIKNDTITSQEKITSDLKIFKITIMLSYQSGSPIQDNAKCGGAGSDLTKAAQQERDCCQRLQSRSLELNCSVLHIHGSYSFTCANKVNATRC